MTDTVNNDITYVKDAAGAPAHALPKLNTLLLEETVNWAIESNNAIYDPVAYDARRKGIREGIPKWLQSSWGSFSTRMKMQHENYCGTSFCIAGKALQDTGNLTFINNSAIHRDHRIYMPEPEVCETVIGFNETLTGLSGGDFLRAGAAVLGLTILEAGQLFDGENGIYTVVEIAQNIAASRGETLDLVEIQSEHLPPAA